MRRRIFTLSVGMTVLVVLAFSLPLAILLRRSMESDALDKAGYRAETVAYYVGEHNRTHAEITAFLARVSDDEPGAVSVNLPDGAVLGTPAPDQDEVGPPHSGGDGDKDRDDRHATPQVSDPTVKQLADGVVKQVGVRTASGPALVRIYLSNEQLREGLGPRLAFLAGGSLIVLLLSVAGAELVSRRLARPLEQTADTAERLARGEMDARAPTTGPAEVAKVGAALNRLADRIDEVIALEREAVADLSHRLRTPLTAMRLQVEALPDREQADELNTQVNSLERALTAVIGAARRPQREGRVPLCDAAAVVGDRAAFWAPLFEDQGREIALELPGEVIRVRAAAEDLAAAVDALVENVAAHTPDGVPMRIGLTAVQVGTGTGARLVVADEGPGIPLGAGERGRSDRGSTGLGLDIARRCAEASGGRIAIHHGTPGGVVELYLGAP